MTQKGEIAFLEVNNSNQRKVKTMENEQEKKRIQAVSDDLSLAFEKLRQFGARVGALEKRVNELQLSKGYIYSKDRTKDFQVFLTVQGCDPGPIDGRFGPLTWQATLKFLGSIDPDFFYRGRHNGA